MGNTTEQYDVAIIGAGVAGLTLTKLLEDSKLKVLLIEKRKNLESLENYRFGTFGDIVKKFHLEKYVIKNYSKFGCYSVNEKIIRKYPVKTFQVVDMRNFVKNTILKCDILTNFPVTTVHRDKDKIIINNKITTRIIVDCSGDQKIVAHKLNLLNKETVDAFSVSFEITNCTIPKNALQEFKFIADINYGSLGLWFYPYSQTECQIGLTDFFSKKFPLIDRQESNLKKYTKNVEPFNIWLKNSNIANVTKKVGPTTTLTTFYDDNFLACGDAAGAGTPYIAEGFRIAVEMALSAKETIEIAFVKKDFSKKVLRNHKENFKKIDNHYTWSTILRNLMLNHFTTKSYDLFIKRLNKLTNQEYYDALRSNFTFRIISKILGPKIILNIIYNILTRKSQVKSDIKQNAKRK